MLQNKLAFWSLLLSYVLFFNITPITATAATKQHQKEGHIVDPNEQFSAAAVADAERNGDVDYAQNTMSEQLTTNEDSNINHMLTHLDKTISDRIKEVVRFGPVAVDHHNSNFEEHPAPPPQEVEPNIVRNNKVDEALDAATASAQPTASTTVINEEATAISYSPVPRVTNCKTQGQIALTYSEGPSDVTAKIARELKAADAHASFFVNATWLEMQQYAMVVQNLYNAGHLIGMTYRVPNDNPNAFTDDELRADIIKNAEIIEKVIQVAPKYVRLHYTEVPDTRTENFLADYGFVIVGYNLDSQDYAKKEVTGPNSIQEMYSETFRKYKDTYDVKGSFISIQYDLPYTRSLSAAPYVINTIDKEGYTMVRLDGCLNDTSPYKESAASSAYVADKFSFGQAEYYQGQKAVVIQEASNSVEEDEEDDMEEGDNFRMQSVEYSNAYSYQRSLSSASFLAFAPLLILLL